MTTPQGHDHGEPEHDHGDHDHDDHDHGHDDGDPEHDHGAHGHDHDNGGSLVGLVGLIRSVFAPHSHDAADSVDSALEASAKGIRAVKVSLIGLFATSGLQLTVVLVSGSVALLADTIHNFSDALTAVPLWIAFLVGRQAATKRYSYGYGRAEDLAGLFVLAMIIGSSVLAAWTSIDRLIHPQVISNLGLVAVAGVIGFAGNELVAIYRIRVGKEIGSAALVADGYHARTDGLTSLAVVVGAAGVWLGYPRADPIVGLLITVAILWVLKGAASQVFGRLMDAVDPALVDQIATVASRTDGVQSIADVRVRWIGHRLEASLHVVVDCDWTVAQGHSVAEAVRHDLFHSVGKLDSILVHIDPCDHDGEDHHVQTRPHDPVQREVGHG